MTDFKTLKPGTTIERDGVELIVTRQTRMRRRGWTRMIASFDGENVYPWKPCLCEADQGEIPAADLVIETDYLICAKCRCRAEDRG
jgi:hypothetical protein